MTGLYFVGPAIRHWFGDPPWFGTDYTSYPAIWQAVIVQTLTTACAFALLGAGVRAWLGRLSIRSALWGANPATVCVGFGIFRGIVGPDALAEYTMEEPWMFLGGVGWLLMLVGLVAGSRVRWPRRRGRSSETSGS